MDHPPPTLAPPPSPVLAGIHVLDLTVIVQGPRAGAVELGVYTEEVLLEAGYTWEEIAGLRAAGAW